MPYKIEKIEGIGKTFVKKLAKASITTTDHLLENCATRKGRKDTAAATGVDEKKLLKWANMADLFRIKGVGTQYAELLEASGIDTVKELRNRKPENLAEKMAEVNKKKKLTRAVPAPSVVARWVKEAKGLTPKIKH